MKKEVSAKTKARIIEKYTPLVLSLAKQYSSKYLPFEDCYQEAVLALLKAAESFDRDKGRFGAWAKIVITNWLKHIYWNEKNKPRTFDVNTVEDFEDNEVSPSKGIKIRRDKIAFNEEGYSLKEIMVGVEQAAGPLGKQLIYLRIEQDMSQEECARILNISQPTVCRIMKRIKEYYEDGK